MAGAGDDAGKIFVGGLPKGCSQEALNNWATQFGLVTKVEVKLDPNGIPRGFGFVSFQDPAVAQQIVANKDNNTMEGKWVDCKMAMAPGTAPPPAKGFGKGGGKGGGVDPSNPKIFVGALPKSATQDSLNAFFAMYGAVKEVNLKFAEDGQCKGFAFVTFEDPGSAKAVLDNYDNNQFEGKWIDCKPVVPKGEGKGGMDKGKGKGKGKGGGGGFGGGGYGGGYGGGCGGGYGGGYGGGCGGGYGGGCGGGYGGGCGGGYGGGCGGGYGGGCGGYGGGCGGGAYGGACAGCYGGGGAAHGTPAIGYGASQPGYGAPPPAYGAAPTGGYGGYAPPGPY